MVRVFRAQPSGMQPYFCLPGFFFARAFCCCSFFRRWAYFVAGLRAVCCRLFTMSVSLDVILSGLDQSGTQLKGISGECPRSH